MSGKLYVHSIETLGALDGPGLRTVVFMPGCPLRCRYCHNADMLSSGAAKGQYSAAELYDKIIRFKEYYGKSGGVTASGGEPLLQAEALTPLFQRLQAAGVNTALDTAGSILNYDVKNLLRYTDCVILDIKHTDADAYDDLCGLQKGAGIYEKVLAFADYCATEKKRLWLRQVIVPGINDNKEQVLRFKGLSRKYNAERVEVLAYHTMGVQKWQKAGLDYTLKDIPPMSEEKLNALRKLV